MPLPSPKRDILQLIKKIHCGGRPFVCSDCGKVFMHETQLKIQQRVHTGEKPYECGQCRKLLTWPYWTYEISHIWTYEIEHMKSHIPKNSYEYKECGKTFKYRSSLNTPESILARNCTKGDNVAKPLRTRQCWACIREFTQARNLTGALNMAKPSSGAHIFFNITHIEQQNKGSTCEKSFNQKTYLVIHQRSHKNKRAL